MNLMNRLPHLTAVLAAFLLSLRATAQDFPIPYNPDDDANGLIGTPDLLSLLALFGEEFSAVVVAEDNESAIMYMGDMAYPVCAQNCRNLPGMWETAGLDDLGLVWDEVYSPGIEILTWLHPSQGGVLPFIFNSDDEPSYSWHNVSEYGLVARIARCYCSIKEIPKVEYSQCAGPDISECTEAKVALGWMPLGGVSYAGDGAYGYRSSQAFWRWAE